MNGPSPMHEIQARLDSLNDDHQRLREDRDGIAEYAAKLEDVIFTIWQASFAKDLMPSDIEQIAELGKGWFDARQEAAQQPPAAGNGVEP